MNFDFSDDQKFLKNEARKFLEAEMEKFFFGGGSDKPSDYVAPKE